MPKQNDDKRKPSDELLKVVASNIKSYRKEKSLTQEKLAELCSFHPTFISLIERQQRNVTISTLEIIAKALGKDVYLLLKK